MAWRSSGSLHDHPAAEIRPAATSASDIASQMSSVWKGFDRFLIRKKALCGVGSAKASVLLVIDATPVMVNHS